MPLKDYEEYLNSVNIKVLKANENLNKEKIYTAEDIYSQLNAIREFHKATMGYKEYFAFKLENCTGKKVEQYKVYIKKFKKDMKKIAEIGAANECEKILYRNREKIIEISEGCIEDIYENSYYDLINRSMRRIEICLGNTWFDNLIKSDSLLVRNLKRSGFNMVEFDGIYLLSKASRRGIDINIKEAVQYFCVLEKLAKSSEKFIISMISFPSETMRCFERYRRDKNSLEAERYEAQICRALEKDGISVI